MTAATNTEIQTFGENPTKVRETDHYQLEYIQGFVHKWDELIDWEARADSEGDFFISRLKERGAKRVLDVATGTGFHSVQLLKAGFEVVSVDGSAEMLSHAFKNGRDHGMVLRTIHADWRWLCRDVHAKFDAVVCLGNSFTHLFHEKDRRKALAEFYSVLKHDGVLILDQRNYDSILDDGFNSKHIYYYCGEDVRAEPEFVDDGLARFKYSFPDGSEYHLNMCPIRKDYISDLMKEVGFTDVKTFGDFKETYHQSEPDFFIHFAEKLYDLEEKNQVMDSTKYQDSDTETAREYYNSNDADHFYYLVWGGEDIHIGMYDSPETPVKDASRKTVERMAKLVQPLDAQTRILDIGSGYAGTARYLAQTYDCYVSCLNLSEKQNDRARELNTEAKLDLQINVVDGTFESIPSQSDSLDLVWCQDAILHSSHRMRVFEEVNRVLASGGRFVFTDPMAAPDADVGGLQPILDRIKLSSLGDIETYRKYARALGWEEVVWEDHTNQLVNHYSKIKSRLIADYDDLVHHCSQEYLENMKTGLQHWIDGGKAGTLQWGIVVFQKP
jgi:sarcosine/dimethylglycine N-methyltransferase